MASILIFSAPRCGTTLLCDLLTQRGNISFYEVFNKSSDTINEYFARHLKLFNSHLPDNFKLTPEYIQDNYLDYYDLLSKVTNNSYNTKIFQFQASKDVCKELINTNDIVIIMLRNLLHSYISDLLSKQLKKWGGVDTTNLKVIFNIPNFKLYVANFIFHIQSVKILLEECDKKYVIFNYETIHENLYSLEEKYKFSIDSLLAHPLPSRQDKRDDALSKVENPELLMKFLDDYQIIKMSCGTYAPTLQDYLKFIF